MRAITLAALLTTGLGAAEELPVEMPKTVTLTTGRVLRNVQVMRWEKARVVLKYTGGAEPVPFTLFRDPAPEQLPAIRAAFDAVASQMKEASAKARAPRKFSGKAWIRTVDHQRHLCQGVVVKVFYKSSAEVDKLLHALDQPPPVPDTTATIAEDGTFSFLGPVTGPVTLFAISNRMAAPARDFYYWLVEVDDGDNRFEPRLTSNNCEVKFIPERSLRGN